MPVFMNIRVLISHALGRAIVKKGNTRTRECRWWFDHGTQQLAKQLYSDVAHSSLERLLQSLNGVIAVKLGVTMQKRNSLHYI